MPPRLTARGFRPGTADPLRRLRPRRLDRRGFLEKAQRFAKAGVTAAGLLAALSPDFAAGQQVRPDDARLKAEWVTVPSPAGYGSIRGYLVRPASAGTARLPAVLVIHENRGLNPHIEDIARRLALDGFMAFAPDALTPLGGYPGDEDKARAAFATLDQAKTREDFLAAAEWLRARSRRQRQARRGGLLLRRRHRALAGDAAAGPERGRAVLRQQPGAGAGGAGQGAAAGAAGRRGRTHQRGLARLRGRAEGGRACDSRCTSTRARSTASTTTPRRATTPPPRSWPGNARSRSSSATWAEPARERARRSRLEFTRRVTKLHPRCRRAAGGDRRDGLPGRSVAAARPAVWW